LNLTAALVCRNEVNRYLPLVVSHLREFCDRLVILDDGSDDGTTQWLRDNADEQMIVEYAARSTFFTHEGRCRGHLLDVLLEQKPDRVVSLDADEIVSDGTALRERIESDPAQDVWSLEMAEVWNADAEHLYIRCDVGWRPHPLSLVWRAPQHGEKWRMLDRALACRRVPMPVLSASAKPSGESVFHLGWLDKSTRQARYNRYAEHDKGRYHASSHLRSILFPDSRIRLQPRSWPAGPVFDSLRERFAVVTA
jgi:glycosyltransferase involved in cell wall biosynthesis